MIYALVFAALVHFVVGIAYTLYGSNMQSRLLGIASLISYMIVVVAIVRLVQ